jgi:hypothetical protein
MKKTVLLVGLVLLAVSGAFAQMSKVAGKTYYYKYVETIDPATEMRSTNRNYWPAYSSDQVPTGFYLTFTSNGCYTSDEKGLDKSYSGITVSITFNRNSPYSVYQTKRAISVSSEGSTESVSYVFRAYYEKGYKITAYLSFSADFKRVNFNASFLSESGGENYNKNVFIYEQASPPRPGQSGPVGPQPPGKLY